MNILNFIPYKHRDNYWRSEGMTRMFESLNDDEDYEE